MIKKRLLAILSRRIFEDLGVQKPTKILIYHVGNIGDTIVATPVYRSIRKAFPQTKITLLTSPGKRGLPGAQDTIFPLKLVDVLRIYYPEEITNPKKLIDFFKGIRKENYGLLIYLPANQWGFWHILRDLIFFRLTGIKYAIGFEIYEGYDSYRKYGQIPVSEVERLKKLVSPLKLTPSKQELEFPVGTEDRCFADEAFKQEGIEEGQLKVVVHPGGKKPSKLWLKQNFALLINKLIEEMRGQVILVGSDRETTLVGEIVKLVKYKVINLTGKLTLSQLAAVIGKVDLVISNDSGPMHIAVAVKTPVIALFSGVDIPYLWYPYGEIHTVLRKDIACSPCFKNECDDHPCMQGISVDKVFQAVKSTLEQKR